MTRPSVDPVDLHAGHEVVTFAAQSPLLVVRARVVVEVLPAVDVRAVFCQTQLPGFWGAFCAVGGALFVANRVEQRIAFTGRAVLDRDRFSPLSALKSPAIPFESAARKMSSHWQAVHRGLQGGL